MANLRRHNQQTVAWFNDLYTRGLLDLEPPYQRRSVWNQAYKDAFIDTILIQYPSPAVFLYQEISPEGQTKMHVVDGKQRLTSIFEFVSGVFPVAETAQTTQLRGKYFEQLPVDVKTNFWTYEFSVEYLPTNEEGLINGIFERINRNTAKLTRQELRHARFSGLFITAAEQLAEWMTKQLPDNVPRFESQSRKQMKDVELVAGLLLLIEEGISGYSQDDLDKAFSDRDVEWDDAADTEQRFREVIDFVNQLVQLPQQDPLLRSRLRNQADFYSLFGAVNELIEAADPALHESKDTLASRLVSFLEIVDDEIRRIKDKDATRYLNAARSNSNDLGQRKQRVETITAVLKG
ncbi:MAG: DUF262 domain-containing protein [Candidatus Sulfotelmatobacter sp.]